MSQNPEVTIVIPTRNRERELRECLGSVLEQDCVTFEVIVVDDASTDDTPTVAHSFHDPRVHYVRQVASRERAEARNWGLVQSRGKYVMFLDDDDLLMPSALRILTGALDKVPSAVAAIVARSDWFVSQEYRRRDIHPRRLCVRNIHRDLLANWSAVSGQNLYRTEVVRHVGGFTSGDIPCEDRDLWLRVAALGPVVLCPETVLSYRIASTQRRPANIRAIRERVARRAIRALPRNEWRAALRIRRMVALVDEAETECTSGSVGRGALLLAQAGMAAPRMFLSSLIGPWIFRRLAGRVARRWIPAPAAQD